ncbi:LPXTG cell wall anchor domain-containing protein [Abiotrophia defectiva]|jgi:iron-regulated surface determinant protein B|uniref:LPXTG cell wall anchor domain-containing protein n=1 Tax=Abiotrophia defectiva TaxID=46125 RepID=UPI00227E7178|nr:LPXTG cell wall anchor domain-containing protein [Abiotrophia defectiva]MCY7224845.1 LPXTG cell wall anchor domain-containing protein [Abiotrophia defectiva]
MMRSFKKIIATLLLFATILVPAFAAQAESLNAILKYSIYDLYSGEFVQEVNFLTHSSKDASIVQTVDWFNQRGIMMDPKRFNLKVSSYLTEYSTSKGNLSAYTADIMVYTTEADVLKNLGIKAETEPGVRNVIEMPQYEPERQMREAWENATNAVPTAITPNAPAAESSSEASVASTSKPAKPNQSNESSSSQASGSEINKPVTVEKSSSNEVGAKPNENSRSNTASQDIAYSVVSESKASESSKPLANKQNANEKKPDPNKTAANSQSESRSEASQAPVVQKKALPKTGEESSFGWLLALVFVIAGAAVLFGYKKTRKQ